MARKRIDKYTQRKDGRYMTHVSTGKWQDDGSSERITIYAETSLELEEKVAELKYLLKSGKYKKPTEITVAEYADKFFETFKTKKAINTKAMYENAIEKHIKPSVGRIRMKDLTYTDCQRMINDRFDHYETCNKIRLTMKQMEKLALRDKIITEGYWNDIEMPKKPMSKKRILTDYEKQAINLANFTPDEKVFIYILYGCGLRREEIIALNASDFNLKERYVEISHVIVFDINSPVMVDAPKTKNGYRKVPIPASIFQTVQFYVRRLMGKEKNHEILKNILLFTTKGELMTKSSYQKMWDRIINKMNFALLPDERKQELKNIVDENKSKSIFKEMYDYEKQITGLTAHIFRHNYATMLYYSGISELKAVELMGHADGKMIKEVYAHLDEEKEKAVERLDRAIVL